jgi:UDP-N-acetylglucosamine acyltransferase
MNIPLVLERLSHRYPSFLVDAVTAHEPGRRIVAVKNVTVSEEFFQGHFPGTPLMPGVLMIESLSQVATLLLLAGSDHGLERAFLRGVDRAKFRRQVVPGDRLELAITRDIGRRAHEATIDRTAVVHPKARLGPGTVVGPFATIGEHVVIGRNCTIGASSVIDGWTTIGDGTQVFPLASIGLAPQDLKYKGEPTRLVIGSGNIFREFVTIHRGTAGGGGETSIGDHNLFMAYAHVAHDCHVGSHTIFGNAATLGGHVTVEDYATISAYSGVHQFCRVGRHAFVGGYTVVTRDALPFAKTVGNRARIYGLNPIGLARRGFSPETINKLRRAVRQLLQHNTSRAVEIIERDRSLAAPEVTYLLEFIATAKRGVILRRPSRRVDDTVEGE